MTLVSPSQSSAGEEINASDINGPVNQLASVINGNLDDTNIASLSGTKITAGTIPATAMAADANIETRFNEALGDFVASGCVWSATTGLGATMTAGVVYIDGKRLSVSSVASRTFTASKDTYVTVSNTGVLGYSEVANGATGPAASAGSIFLAKVVTNGSAVTSVTLGGDNSAGAQIYPENSARDATWKTWSPTIGCGSGAFTSVSAGDCRYIQFGKTVHFKARINIVTNGTAATSVTATLPVAVNATAGIFTCSGREDGVSGKQLQGKINTTGTLLSIFNYDNTYPGASNAAIIVTGTYEAA